nr:zinc-ribbon domain-containing protein [Pectobacterium peruviense]
MRFLKCYLANNAKNRFVNATEASRQPLGHWGTGRVHPVVVR